MGHDGMKTKVLISQKGTEKHLDVIRVATAPNAHEDSVTLKIKAVNRIISGWCRYYQYTSEASKQFARLEYATFWRLSHWLGRKLQLSMPQVMARFNKGSGLGEDEVTLLKHTAFPTRQYKKRFLKPNPYTTQERIEREELPDESPWTGFEIRPGWADIKHRTIQRDNWTCQVCKRAVTAETCEVDHVRPYSHFKRPVDANRPDNLWTLCINCHRIRTEMYRQMESPVR
jgi:5-methylcytosine-specific restriction endonuclease McrA